jgi:putative sterol carrier protein
MFKDMMVTNEQNKDVYPEELKKHFKPQPGFSCICKFNIKELGKPLVAKIKHTEIECFYGDTDKCDVEISVSAGVLDQIIAGQSTFQRGFMSGDMKIKGDFKVLRTLDVLFVFN